MVDEIPSAKEVFDYYQLEAENFGGHHQNFMYRMGKPWHEARLDKFYELINRFGTPPYLDVGCAEGWFLEDDNWVGVDLSLPKLRRGRGRRVWADWDHPPFRPRSFSTIFFADGLEHSRYPEETIAALVPLCKYEGHIIFSVTGECKGEFGKSGHLHGPKPHTVLNWFLSWERAELVYYEVLDLHFKFIMGVLKRRRLRRLN
jgi:hypothetical protein